jgi:hypothetical protein
MKKLIVFLIIMVGFAMQAMAYDFQSGNLLYTINSIDPPTVILTGHADGYAAHGELVIPETVTYEGTTYSVTIIEKRAFNGCSGLTGTLVIPNSIVEIKAAAFCDCVGFTGDLVIPNSVTKMNIDLSYESTVPGAFENCTGFDGRLVLSNSLDTIGDARGGGCFSGCNNLTGELVLPNTLTYIGGDAFAGCSGFTGILVIPESVTQINSHAFAYCTGIEDVVFPTVSVPFVNEGGLFSGCSGLTSITLPEGWITTGDYTFASCTGLREVHLPESMKVIGRGCFEDCTNLASINFPVDLDEIILFAFLRCTGLSDAIVINAKRIYRLSFGSCTGIRHLVLGEHLNYISEVAFKDTNIETMTIKAIVPPELDSSDIVYAWHFDRNLPITVPCSSLEAYQNAEVWGEFANMNEGATDLFSAVSSDENAGTVAILKEATCKDGTVKVEAMPNPGYEFLYWEANGIQVSSDNPYIFELEEDTELVAFFSSDGVDEMEQIYSVYPNPAKDLVRIEGLESSEVRIYNTLGQLVSVNHGTNEISVRDSPNGVYLLRITDVDGSSFTSRIIVAK